MGLWTEHVVPFLVEKACRSGAIKEERERWVPRAHGRVLELGVGSGLNLAFYDAARVDEVVGIDPSTKLLDRAKLRAKDAPVRVELKRCAAESLPFDDGCFDSAVVTYTLCSVDDPARVLAELKRVLKPDAELYFVEHGLATDARTRRWQHRLTPAWSMVGGGCRLDRDVFDELRTAGFSLEETRAAFSEDGPRFLGFTYEGVAKLNPRGRPSA